VRQINDYQTKLQLGEEHVFQSALAIEADAMEPSLFSSFKKHLQGLIPAKKEGVQKKERGLD